MLSTDIRTLASAIDQLTADCPAVVINRHQTLQIVQCLETVAVVIEAMEHGKPVGEIPPLRVVAGTDAEDGEPVVSFPHRHDGGAA
jgi:galactose-1-phosphate uridylyltransferase